MRIIILVIIGIIIIIIIKNNNNNNNTQNKISPYICTKQNNAFAYRICIILVVQNRTQTKPKSLYIQNVY